MAVINSKLASVISHAVASQQAQQASTSAAQQGSNDNFGPATQVSLSPAAQAVLPAQSSSGAQGPAASAPVPVTSSSSTTDSELLVQEALQQVIPKVGVQNASQVVDSKGDINTVKLNELIARQEQAVTPPQVSLSA